MLSGIDSRYNEGMQECTNYLLFGLLESNRQDLVRYCNYNAFAIINSVDWQVKSAVKFYDMALHDTKTCASIKQ